MENKNGRRHEGSDKLIKTLKALKHFADNPIEP
jgi:hypothetical protein